MLRGVNKQIIEINSMENAYFEKAILYIRPECFDTAENKLRSNAAAYLDELSLGEKPPVKEAQSKGGAGVVVAIVGAAVVAVVAALVITLI